jgi:D-glycero-beta-D-manno-heptose 1-phosphate adenylyltransferase
MSLSSSSKTKKISNILSSEVNLNDRIITDQDHLLEIVHELKDKGYKIALTQGVWDLIHEGHALYLEKAKSYGDVLIVGVDSDELTRERKGNSRPIVPQKERISMLLHLRHVDIVTIRELNQDIGSLIRLVSPDVLITSKSTSDFTAKLKKEYEPYCKKIVTLSPQATTSTTARIRNITIDGAEQLACEVRKITERFIKRIKQGK